MPLLRKGIILSPVEHFNKLHTIEKLRIYYNTSFLLKK